MRPENAAKTRWRRCAWFLTAAVLLSGCAAAPMPPAGGLTVPPPPPAGENGWWYARFRMHWPEGAEPLWHLDLLAANRIVKPVLEDYSADIPLWRFHRRAARDAAGHQFSFIFFAAPETARKVYAALSRNSTLAQAQADGRILEIVCDDTAGVFRPEIGATSDPSWSAALRRSWPFYLMGASRMWLDLIAGTDEGMPQDPPATSGFEGLEHRYAGINASITALWQNEGRHAFLHHLNALFGYEPILIIEKRPMRF